MLCYTQDRILAVFLLGLLLVSCKSKQVQEVMETPLEDLLNHTFLENAVATAARIPNRNYDPNLSIFVDQFIDEAKARGVNISSVSLDMLREIKYVDQLSIGNAPGVMASCNRFLSQEATLAGEKTLHWTTIEVMTSRFNDYIGTDPTSKLIYMREVLFHEIDHCLLGLGHLPANVAGLMNPYFQKGNPRPLTDWKGMLDDTFSAKFRAMQPVVSQ